MARIWAMVQDGMVINTIMASDDDYKDPDYLWVDLTGVDPQPGIGWTYDGSTLSQPVME